MSLPEDVESIVLQSGNSFHCRVVDALRRAGWQTLVSPYYMDSGTGKARELDLVAEKYWIADEQFGQGRHVMFVRLFIECKYVPQPVVFWFDDKDLESTYAWLESHAGLPREDNSYTKRHHYLATSKATKLFAGSAKTNPENDIVYKALNQSLNAMVYLRGQEPKVEARYRRLPVDLRLEIPVVICNSFDQFYQVEMAGHREAARLEEAFQLEVNYAYVDRKSVQRSEYFLIDLVSFDGLDGYFAAIEGDMGVIAEFRDWSRPVAQTVKGEGRS